MIPPLWQPNVVHNSFAAVLRVVGSAVDPVMVMVCVCVVSVVSTTLCQRINNLILAQQLPSSWWPAYCASTQCDWAWHAFWLGAYISMLKKNCMSVRMSMRSLADASSHVDRNIATLSSTLRLAYSDIHRAEVGRSRVTWSRATPNSQHSTYQALAHRSTATKATHTGCPPLPQMTPPRPPHVSVQPVPSMHPPERSWWSTSRSLQELQVAGGFQYCHQSGSHITKHTDTSEGECSQVVPANVPHHPPHFAMSMVGPNL